MGYRSDVVIVVKKDVVPKELKTFAVEYAVDHFMEESDWELYNFKWIKYEEDNEDIQVIVKALNQLKISDYFFMRLGEAAGDYEEAGSGHTVKDFPFLINPTYHAVYCTTRFDSDMYWMLQSIKNNDQVLLKMLKEFIADNPALLA